MLGWHRVNREKVSISEIFGLTPVPQRLREMSLTFRGDPLVPPSRFGVSSIKMFMPRISFPTWFGAVRDDGLIPLWNLFNHTPTPTSEGWSVRKTQLQDFRGGSLTYDSHNGTDFVIPPGTPVTSAAPGQVLLISNDFNRGGLKIFIDNGHGIATSYNHLSRSLVEVGDIVERGQVIALSGASGLDAFLTFPWVAPHVHFNVWLNGVQVDPFARLGTDEISLWLSHNDPVPYQSGGSEEYEPNEWDEEALIDGVQQCLCDDTKSEFYERPSLEQKGMYLMMHASYYPNKFPKHPRFYTKDYERTPHLDLPFLAKTFSGIVFPD